MSFFCFDKHRWMITSQNAFGAEQHVILMPFDVNFDEADRPQIHAVSPLSRIDRGG